MLKIDLVSDVSCPWCVIGYQSLHAALEKLKPQLEAEITFRPFELNPQMGAEGQPLLEHLQQKYGAAESDLRKTQDMITERGKQLGFTFNFSAGGRIYNTFDAHRLLYWAREKNQQTVLKLALFRLYFSEGGNPSSHDALLAVVDKAGLPVTEARQVLESGRYATEVREEEAHFTGLGIQSVPTFIINDQYKITGGQPVETFVELLQKIQAEIEHAL